MRIINFIKDNSYIIVKCMLNQLGLTIFGFMLSMAVGQNENLQLITSIFSVGFYLFLQYSMMWTIGFKDKEKVDNKRIPYQPFKGAYISILANSINLLLGFLMIIGQFLHIDDLYVMTNFITKLLQAMYLGISVNVAVEFHSLLFFLAPLPAILICGLAYYMGVQDKRILKIFGIDTTQSKKNNNL